jgi:hypothetical protein
VRAGHLVRVAALNVTCACRKSAPRVRLPVRAASLLLADSENSGLFET